MWALLYALSVTISWTFSMSVIVVMFAELRPVKLARARQLANDLWNELKYVYLIESVVGPFLDNVQFGKPATVWDYIGVLVGVGLWFYWRRYFKDDDRWQRRKRKLAEKVEQVGGRLVVVPARG
jgi:hypothetical protein